MNFETIMELLKDENKQAEAIIELQTTMEGLQQGKAEAEERARKAEDTANALRETNARLALRITETAAPAEEPMDEHEPTPEENLENLINTIMKED